MYQHILATTDFSDASHQAIDAAANLATRFGAKLSLVNVYDVRAAAPAMFPNTVVDVEAALRDASNEQLARLKSERLASHEDVQTVALPHLSAARAVVDYAQDNGVDLCVVGTHGRTGIVHMLLGSVAEKVVRYAHCDVLVVGRESPPDAPFARDILLATDMSEPSLKALDSATKLADKFGAKLTALHVSSVGVGMPPMDHVEAVRPSDEQERKTRLLELDQWRAAHLGGANKASAEVVTSTVPAMAICDYAAEHDKDMIVVATHGRTGVARMLIGSVAERVARHAPCPVMVVRVSG